MQNRTILKAALIALSSSFVVTLGGIFYTGITNAEHDRKWCSLLITMDDTYSATKPTTELGQRLARDIKELRQNIKC